MPIHIRHGDASDAPTLLALFDDAVQWLNSRGQPEQWGTEPFSSKPKTVERVENWATSGGLWLANENDGAIVLGEAFDYVPPPDRPELYVEVLLTNSQKRNTGVGAALIAHAAQLAQQQNAEQLRVDCYAGNPALPAQYESLGFTKTGDFEVNGWPGAVLTLRLPDRSP